MSENNRVLDYEFYMNSLIDYIRENSVYMPYGASIVNEEGEILVTVIADGLRHPLLHCELAALLECGYQYPDCDWTKLTLFSTGEACSMCTSGMCWLGLKAFVYGADIPFLMKTVGRLGWETPIRAEAMYRSDAVFAKYQVAHQDYHGGQPAKYQEPQLIRDICKRECEQLVNDFLPKFMAYIEEIYPELVQGRDHQTAAEGSEPLVS